MLNKHKLTNLFLIAFSIITFSLISTFLPQHHIVTLFILYFVILTILARIVKWMRRGKNVDVKKIKPLVKVSREEIVKAIERDIELSREVAQQIYRMPLLVVSMIIIWLIFSPLMKDFYMNLVQRLVHIDQLTTFVGYVMLYSTLTIIAQAMRIAIMPKKNIVPVLNEYLVGREGIYSKGLFIPFPLDRTRFVVEANMRRGFVEIYDRHTRQAYRFYSNDVRKILDIIEKAGKAV